MVVVDGVVKPSQVSFGALRPPARRHVVLPLLGVIALGLQSSLPASSRSPVHLETTPAASSPWLDRFNQWRASTGLPSLTENTLWSQGDYDHSLYMVKNDLVTHYETPGVPYYTVDGDTAARNGNIQVSSTTSLTDGQAIDWWMGAPFHAMNMMDPRLTQTGFGAYRDSTTSPWQAGFTLDTIRGNTFSGGTFPVFFPGNGSTEPLTAYSGNEFPDPLQGCPGYNTPVGLPIFIEIGGNVATSVGPVHTLTGNGVPLNHCVIASNTNATLSSYLTERGGVIVVPQSPLQNGVKYVVSLTVNGTPYTWSFTVGPFRACVSVTTSAAPASEATVGSPVVITASAAGCPNTPLYEFWILAPGASLYTLAQGYSSSPTFTWSTSGKPPGTYRYSVWARDSNSPGNFSNASGTWDVYDASLYYSLTAGCSHVTTSDAPASPQMVGASVTVTAAATGCPSSPLYEFWVLAPGEGLYTLAQAYSSSPTLNWTTTGHTPGTYRFSVWARDTGSAGTFGNASGTWDAYDASLYYSLSGGCASVSVTSGPPSAAMVGMPVTITAVAAGCANPRYEFWILAPGAGLYTLAQAYSSSATFSWSTSGKATGTYRYSVWVRDAASAGVSGNASGTWDAYDASLYYTLLSGCASLAVSASPGSPQAPGTLITVNASATGCLNPQYEFWVLAPGASLYTLAQAYSSSPTLNWSTTGKSPGTYRFSVWVRDSGSAGMYGNASGTWDAYNAGLYYALS